MVKINRVSCDQFFHPQKSSFWVVILLRLSSHMEDLMFKNEQEFFEEYP